MKPSFPLSLLCNAHYGILLSQRVISVTRRLLNVTRGSVEDCRGIYWTRRKVAVRTKGITRERGRTAERIVKKKWGDARKELYVRIH